MSPTPQERDAMQEPDAGLTGEQVETMGKVLDLAAALRSGERPNAGLCWYEWGEGKKPYGHNCRLPEGHEGPHSCCEHGNAFLAGSGERPEPQPQTVDFMRVSEATCMCGQKFEGPDAMTQLSAHHAAAHPVVTSGSVPVSPSPAEAPPETLSEAGWTLQVGARAQARNLVHPYRGRTFDEGAEPPRDVCLADTITRLADALDAAESALRLDRQRIEALTQENADLKRRLGQ